jgi:hypothetical protein
MNSFTIGALFAFLIAPHGDDPTALEKLPLPKLSQEVDALQTLYELQVTPAQLKALKILGEETGARPGGRPNAKASKELRTALIDLRAALIKADDGERISELLMRYNELDEKETPELEDDYEITEDAVEKVPEALRLFTAAQVAIYAGLHVDRIADPRAHLREALDAVRPLTADEWTVFRDSLGEEIGQILAGIDAEKAQRINNDVVQWLIVIRSLNNDDFKKQRPELERKIDAIVGQVGPTDILRHFMEHALADLLSNPRLLAAIDARLK